MIKFNIDRINLKNVEIGSKYIYLSFGRKERTQKIRILHGGINNQEMESLKERFVMKPELFR